MAQNDRIQYDLNDIPYEQLAPSKAGRTSFTPGKAQSRPNDQNWPEEFRIPTGNRAFDQNAEEIDGPVRVTRVRVVKLGRNIVDDTELREPKVLATKVETIKCDCSGTCGTHVVSETETVNPAAAERQTEGYDWAEGAT